MSTTKNLGIWMDHSDAHLISFNGEVSEITTISNPFNHDEKEEALSRSENLMHNKNQQHLNAFYQNLSSEIISCNNVLLFGPTDAKTELFNMLRQDLRYKDITVAVKQTDKMTDNQKKQVVRDYFSN